MDTPTTPHPVTDAELAGARRAAPPTRRTRRIRRIRRIRRGTVVALGLLVLAVAATTVDGQPGTSPATGEEATATATPSTTPDGSTTTTDRGGTDRAGRARRIEMADRPAADEALPAGTPPTTAHGDGFGPAGPGGPAGPAAPGGAQIPAGPPRLEVIPSIVLDDGVYETDVVLRNTGQAPLSWHASTESGDVAAPGQGVIPAGGQAIVHVVADEYASGSKEWTHRLVVHSDGGDATVDLHGTTLLPPMLDLAGGTYVNQLGNVFVFPNGAINVGLQLKNDGDLDLHLTRSIGANGKILGAADEVIEGGQTEFLAFSLCGVPVPAVATSVDVHVLFDAGAAGVLPAVFRFNLNAGQPTGPC